MKHSRANPYLKILLDGLAKAAPNWLQAAAVTLPALAEQLTKQDEHSTKQLAQELQSITQEELNTILQEYGAESSEIIQTAISGLQVLPMVFQQRFDKLDYDHEMIKKLIIDNIERQKKNKTCDRLRKNVPKNIETFTGRENDLKELHDLLEHEGTVLLLNGLGGIGKTTVAMEYAERNKDHYSCILWLDYLTTFPASFLAINDLFGYTGTEQEIYQQIIAELSRYDGKNLLIIDNFHQEKENKTDNGKQETNKTEQADSTKTPVSELQSLLSNFTKLITSREEIPAGFVKTKYLDTMPPDEAVQLFKQYYTKPYDTEILNKLFELIDYHTLTIELIAKTLEQSMGTVTLEKIHDIYQAKEFDTPSGDIKTPLDYHNLQTNINNYLGELFTLADIPETRITLLRQFALFPPIEIEDAILADIFGGDSGNPHEFVDIIGSLIRGGWLIKTKNGTKCHRLIRQVILQNYPSDYESAARIVGYISDQLYCEPEENPIEKARWIPFALSLLENLHEENEAIGTLCNNLSRRYYNLGDYNQALTWAKKATGIIEKALPADHPSLATSYNNLALIYKYLGDLKQALKWAEKANKIYEKVLPEDHPSLATSYNNLAQIYQDLGDLKQALKWAEKSNTIKEKVLPADLPSLATSYNNLSLIYKDLSELEQALQFKIKSLDIEEKVLPKDHPQLASSYNNLAMIYQDLGDLKQALRWAEKSNKIYEKVLPPDHPDLAISYNNLATIFYNLGDLKQALTWANKATGIYKKVLPADHPSLATSYNNLATIYQDLDETQKAQEYRWKAEEIQRMRNQK